MNLGILAVLESSDAMGCGRFTPETDVYSRNSRRPPTPPSPGSAGPDPEDVPLPLVNQMWTQSGHGPQENFSLYSNYVGCSCDGNNYCFNCVRPLKVDINGGPLIVRETPTLPPGLSIRNHTMPAKVPLANDLKPSSRKTPLNVGPIARGCGQNLNEVDQMVLTELVHQMQGNDRSKEHSKEALACLEWPQVCTTDALFLDVDQGPPTTLMIRNIPSPYTPEDLLQEWPNNCTYDFFYLPYNSRLQRNLTYAFINFTTEKAAMEFKGLWQNMRLSRHPSQKPLNIGIADMQGRDENLRQLRKKRLLYTKAKQCQPIVFRSGVRIHLEKAVAQLDAPSSLCLTY